MNVDKQFKIEGIEATTEAACIVCGEYTIHRHAYSNRRDFQIPVCKKCCDSGCGGKHSMIQIRNKIYFCRRCKKEIKEDEINQIMDNVFLCPYCEDPVELQVKDS